MVEEGSVIMNRDELFQISEEATDIQCKLRGIYELLEVLQTAEVKGLPA